MNKEKDIPRCKEHQLYLYQVGIGIAKNVEIIATCKLGCVEFWDKEEWEKWEK